MVPLFLAVAVLALLDCCRASWYGIMRPHPGLIGRQAVSGGEHGLVARQALQGVENVIYSANFTTFNSIIVPLTLSKDESYSISFISLYYDQGV